MGNLTTVFGDKQISMRVSGFSFVIELLRFYHFSGERFFGARFSGIGFFTCFREKGFASLSGGRFTEGAENKRKYIRKKG